MKVTQHSKEFVEGTSSDVAQRQIIHDNVVTWHRDRRKRESRIAEEIRHRQAQQERRTFDRGFNSVSSAFTGKRVGV